MKLQLNRGRHSVYLLLVHLIFVCKRRGKVFDQVHWQRLELIFAKVCEDFEATLVEFNGEQDHVHLRVNYPPKVTVSGLVNSLKGVSSRRLKQEFPDLERFGSVRKRNGALWSPSYFAASVGDAPIEILRQYLEQQDRPD